MERKHKKTKDDKKLNLAATLFLPPEFKVRKWIKAKVLRGNFYIYKWIPESQAEPTVIPKGMYEKALKKHNDIQQVLRNNKKIKSFLRTTQANRMAQLDNMSDAMSLVDPLPPTDDLENSTVVDTVVSNQISVNDLLDEMNFSSNFDDDNETEMSNTSPLPDELNH